MKLFIHVMDEGSALGGGCPMMLETGGFEDVSSASRVLLSGPHQIGRPSKEAFIMSEA